MGWLRAWRRFVIAGLAVLLLGGWALIAGWAGPAAASVTPDRSPAGYWMVASDGGIFTYGRAAYRGSTGAIRLRQPVVAMAATPTGQGYWMAARDGGVFAFGDAPFWGSAAPLTLTQPVVAMAGTPSGRGYWLVTADGAVYPFGDATYHGAATSLHLNQPVVGFAATPSGHGYWLASADGGVYSFGDAPFHGSAGALRLAQPIVTMVATPSGGGYWLVASDGGVFTYGDARFMGSTGAMALNRPIVGASATPDGNGYWLVASDGGIFSFGAAPFFGSAAQVPLAAPVVGMAAVQPHLAPEVVAFYYPWYANEQVDGQVRHWDEAPPGQPPHQPPDDIGSDFYPVAGAYSSSDPPTVDQQMQWLAQARVDKIIVSWWGQGSFEDSKLPLVMNRAAAHGIRVGISMEPYGGRTVASTAADLAYLRGLGITDFWVYRAIDFPAESWTPLLNSLSGIRVMETGGSAAWAAVAGFTGVYTYDGYNYSGASFPAVCGAARAHQLLCSPSVAPGFSSVRAEGQDPAVVKSRNNGATYDEMWQGAIASGADVLSITSFNEWHEGTQIEPAQDFCPVINGSLFCYDNYEGAYGLSGTGASRVYLDRTAYWGNIWRSPRG